MLTPNVPIKPFVIAVCFGLFYIMLRWREIDAALAFGRHYKKDSSAPQQESLLTQQAAKRPGMLREMVRFDHSIAAATQSRTLQYFDVGQNLAPVYRSVPTTSGFLRPIAGWCLLLGLMITLFNLKGAVENLSKAFQVAPSGQTLPKTPEPESPAITREENVARRMAEMSDKAASAFGVSFGFISLALLCGVSSTILERRAREAVFEFEQSAMIFYSNSLPGQLPVTEGKVAQLLAENMAGLGEVIEELRGASGAFSNLQPLITSMSAVTGTIEAAMRQLPEDLQSSMSNVTSEMVSQLNETLGESAEYTKKILAIYAEQELRVKGLHSIVNSTQSALSEIKATHKILEELPSHVARLADAATSVAANSKELSIKIGVIPAQALAEASSAIVAGKVLLEDSAEKLESVYRLFDGGLPTSRLSHVDGDA